MPPPLLSGARLSLPPEPRWRAVWQAAGTSDKPALSPTLSARADRAGAALSIRRVGSKREGGGRGNAQSPAARAAANRAWGGEERGQGSGRAASCVRDASRKLPGHVPRKRRRFAAV